MKPFCGSGFGRGKKRFRVLSSAGRASPLQGESRRFDPVSTHHSLKPLPKKSIHSIIA